MAIKMLGQTPRSVSHAWNDFTDCSRDLIARGSTDLAIQPGVGLLSQRRPRDSSSNHPDFGITAADLTKAE